MGGGLTAFALSGHLTHADPRSPAPRWGRMQDRILEAIGEQMMALDLRWLDDDNQPRGRFMLNETALLPVASAFKAFVALYYLWTVPQAEWRVDEFSPLYRMIVVSDNLLTGTVIADVAPYITLYGNPLEKFNDFLLYTMGLKNGLYTWKWEGNPIEGYIDRRFEPSLEGRFALVKGVQHTVDNLMTAEDLANGYAFMLNPPTDVPGAVFAAESALKLLSIPAKNYQSPFERAGLLGYTGKDGILQKDDISTGNVVADAGIITLGEPDSIDRHRFIVAFLSAGQTEYSAINTLKSIAEALIDF